MRDELAAQPIARAPQRPSEGRPTSGWARAFSGNQVLVRTYSPVPARTLAQFYIKSAGTCAIRGGHERTPRCRGIIRWSARRRRAERGTSGGIVDGSTAAGVLSIALRFVVAAASYRKAMPCERRTA